MTDQCNFDCAYCYEPRGNQRLDFSTLIKAVDFLRPRFSPECLVAFYGGEPLLAFDLLKRAVEYIDAIPAKRRVKIRYALTTNGSLLNDDILGFLDAHAFSLTLSFDGTAQDLQRKKGTFDHLTALIPRILARPRISLETNSVFSAETIGCLSESVQIIIGLGVKKVDVNFAHKPPWTDSALRRLEEELGRVGEHFLSRYEKLADIPWSAFHTPIKRAVYSCPAGLMNQLALSAQGTLWGCALLPHYFAGKTETAEHRKYCLGGVDEFIKNHRRILAQKSVPYLALRMDDFATPDRACLICGEIEQCWICPVAAAFTTGEIGRIPSWNCRKTKIFRKAKAAFINQFCD